jgi:hypothetical protein
MGPGLLAYLYDLVIDLLLGSSQSFTHTLIIGLVIANPLQPSLVIGD